LKRKRLVRWKLLTVLFRASRGSACRNSVFSVNSSLCFQERKAKAHRTTQRVRLAKVALARIFCLAQRSGDRQAGNVSQVAPQRVSAFLEMEVAKRWSPLVAVEPAPNHPAIWAGESNLGRGANRHKLAVGHRIVSKAFLGGLHHDYRLEKEAA
jgi:hypothetical protein